MNNLTTRTLSGIAYVGILLAGLLINQYLFAALVAFVIVTMMHEYNKLPSTGSFKLMRWLATATAIIFFALVFIVCDKGADNRIIFAAIFPLVATMGSSLFYKDREHIEDAVAYTMSGLLYIGLPLGLSPLVVLKGGEFNATILLCFFIMIWLSDSGAYCIGTAFGQKPDSRKLCPHISPKKSWIGFWGGVATSVIAAVVMSETGFMKVPVVHAVVLGLILSVLGAAGDLFESQWKRHFGIKDSGNIIPGHGGMLDRFDSTVFAMPAAAVYLYLFNLL